MRIEEKNVPGFTTKKLNTFLGIFFLIFALSACQGSRLHAATNSPTGESFPPPSSDSPGIDIHDIQGSGHTSPLAGKSVQKVSGIVTACSKNGFYIQSPQPDELDATSEGIYVFTNDMPRVATGDLVEVSGVVMEFIPGGKETGNLSITEIQKPVITILSTDNPLPGAITLGREGRMPPASVIDDDRLSEYNPSQDGIDFFESLEGMRVQINQALVIGPTNAYGEIVVLADGGAGVDGLGNRSVLTIHENDYNPERIMLDDGMLTLPNLAAGDALADPIIGVMDYSFGNYKVQVTQKLNEIHGNLLPESLSEAEVDILTLATYNVENLDPFDGDEKFTLLARQIVDNLKSPDVIALQEIQDNSGPLDDGQVEADKTFNKLITAIRKAGGPAYTYVDTPVQDNNDGGETGGNIRAGFLIRSDSGVVFQSTGNPRSPARYSADNRLTPNPARIKPNAQAFRASRKPLAMQITKGGRSYLLINIHLSSKNLDTPLFGAHQPPILFSEPPRLQQAQVIHAFIADLLQKNPDAYVVLLGDMNDFQFSKTLQTLAGKELLNIYSRLPREECYTYIHEGNGQALDHILYSRNLEPQVVEARPVHINVEFPSAGRVSGHDPVILRLAVP